jgi:hypothetical protein
VSLSEILEQGASVIDGEATPGKLDCSDGKPLNQLAMAIYGWAKMKGWSHTREEIPSKLLLITSEISEAYEHYRNGLDYTDIFYHASGKPDGFAIEIIDAIIRELHLLAELGVDIDKLMAIKMAYNDGRPYRHGGKRA